MTPRARRCLLVLGLPVLALGWLAGCGPQDTTSAGTAAAPAAAVAASAAACRALAGASTARPRSTPGPGSAVRALPDVWLPCLGDAGTVQLGQVRGPAIVNLWASWCGPCRDELPAFQRYAQQAAGRVSVLGVNIADSPAGRTSIVTDLGLTFPILVDERAVLRGALGRAALPITVFVDADGRMVHVYNDVALDDARLRRLAEQHLGVALE